MHVILLRTYRIPRPVTIKVRPEYQGCRSWIELHRDLPFEGTPVLSDDEFERAAARDRGHRLGRGTGAGLAARGVGWSSLVAGARRHPWLTCALALALLCAAATGAQAKILQAESVLPPGQSGYVSVPGVASGTGSPHLDDQRSLFTSFGFKSALFGQGGQTELPKAGVKIVRDPYGVPAVTGASRLRRLVGRRATRWPRTGCSSSSCSAAPPAAAWPRSWATATWTTT